MEFKCIRQEEHWPKLDPEAPTFTDAVAAPTAPSFHKNQGEELTRLLPTGIALLSLLPAIAPALAADGELLMLGAQINFMRGVETGCENLLPGYASRFDQAYERAKTQFLSRIGVNDAVLAEAQATPELNIDPLVAKFNASSTAQRKQYCESNVNELKSLAATPIH